ncbi:hypothetical protein GGX14DRAFT_694595, partial [Mycena pura]
MNAASDGAKVGAGASSWSVGRDDNRAKPLSVTIKAAAAHHESTPSNVAPPCPRRRPLHPWLHRLRARAVLHRRPGRVHHVQLQRGRRLQHQVGEILAERRLQRAGGGGRPKNVCRRDCVSRLFFPRRCGCKLFLFRTYTQCFTADNCTMTIPFNGTGITLFVAIDYGDIYNTSISLDGAPPANHFAYNSANVEGYNFTLYDVQGLAWTPHSLSVALAPGVSRLLFDYAAVTGDAPSHSKGSGAAAAAATAPSAFLSAVIGALVLAARRSLWRLQKVSPPNACHSVSSLLLVRLWLIVVRTHSFVHARGHSLPKHNSGYCF